MSRNIKEIGKELMGKSLSSYHRKTGLPQLEKNNEMQDGILNGILSQVDNAYIEKTEQSNVIHLEGSGDGVVVLDSVEGNTMVNILKYKNIQWVGDRWNDYVQKNQLIKDLKTNTEYTIVVDVSNWNYNQGITLCCDDTNVTTYFKGNSISINGNGRYIAKRTTKADFSTLNIYNILYSVHNPDTINGTCNVDMMIFEGDWTDKEIPPYFEGLQSSFEENITDEGQYKFEILSHKGRPNELKEGYNELQNTTREYLSVPITDIAQKYIGKRFVVSGKIKSIGNSGEIRVYALGKYQVGFSKHFNCNTSSYIDFMCEGKFEYNANGENGEKCDLSFYGVYDSGVFPCVKDIKIEILDDNDTILATEWCPHYKDDESYWLSHKNSNKIKLLINEPLRSLPSGKKDILCVKEGKLVIERNCMEIIFNGSENWGEVTLNIGEGCLRFHTNINIPHSKVYDNAYCDKIIVRDTLGEGLFLYNANSKRIDIRIQIDKLPTPDLEGFKQWLQVNPTTVVYQLEEPYYEEILNEYGEPILLEGYENGTLYIDSIIAPTTTIRYTPKMESFNTLKEVKSGNNLLTDDINDNIIPYMMDVDLMIMEKEMDLISSFNKNIRTMEVLDMTSMQKRTQQMLERLIKGKTLSEQECQTRVTTYLNANKITDEQAEELMLLISEVYA